MAKIRKTTDGKYMFWCPGCDGAHVFDGTWTFNQNLDTPTVSPSILVTGHGGEANPGPGARCHLYVRDGTLQFLEDSTHALAGKTAPMVEGWG